MEKGTNISPVVLNTWDGHIVLMCKMWYNVEGVDFFEAIKRFWCVRCGLSIEHFSNDYYEYIADKMYKIMIECDPDRMRYFYQTLHRELVKDWYKPEGMSPIQQLIWEYRSFIQNILIKSDDGDGNMFELVSLPKPQKRTIKRIVKGKIKSNDYDLIINADKRKL